MTQTIAIFVDAYRELNARKLFWITMILSGILVAIFALLGVTPTSVKLATLEFNVQSPDYVYKKVFSWLVGLWISWGAVILALISTAGIFPEFMAGGSIDLYFSKPISRLRLFFTKWATGLLFVFLQAGVFAIGAFIIFGLRGGKWLPSILLIVPLVLCLYSYLYAVAVLLGVLTRSAVATILLTVLVWAIVAAGGWIERQLFDARVQQRFIATTLDNEVKRIDAKLQSLKDKPSVTNAFGIQEQRLQLDRERRITEGADARRTADQVAGWHDIAYMVATLLPKTSETTALFDRKLFDDSDLVAGNEASKGFLHKMVGQQGEDEEMKRHIDLAKDAELEAERARRSRSVPWVIGTSLAFEAIVLVLAAWLFCRRDY